MIRLLRYSMTILLLLLPLLSTTVAIGNDRLWSQYIETSDGTKLAADIFLPENVSGEASIPALLYFTRYWRSKEYDPDRLPGNPAINFFNHNGYAVISVDVRGTGASFGSRSGEFSLQETKDYGDVFDWVVKQPWSNGNIATFGISYAGNTAEHASFIQHPALKAIVPRFTDFDWYASLLFPGGFKNKIISSNWGDMVWAMDLNKFGVGKGAGTKEFPVVLGVRPVDADGDKKLLAKAVAQHKKNINVATALKSVEFRDDYKTAANILDSLEKAVTPFRFKSDAEVASVPAFHWAGWSDAGTAAGVLSRFSSFKTPGLFIIGPWNHGAKQDTNPFNSKDTAVQPSIAVQYQQILAFLEPYLLGNTTGKSVQHELRYFTMGEDVWKTTDIWPPMGVNNRRLYLGDNHSLVEEQSRLDKGSDSYKVNFEVGSGSSTRWSTQMGGTDVYYGDRAEADKNLLTYASAPLEEDIEITGAPMVDLYLSSTHGDGGVIAYLEMISPDGVVTMITEGQLRFVNRKISDDPPPYVVAGPYHTFMRKDAELMPVDKVERVTFAMLPTSIRVPKGFSLKLALAGHDKDTFVRIPQNGQPIWSVQRNAIHASFLSLPLISQKIN
ncbi:MAG: hydrolase [Alphaproteobacteria bacterium]|nr:MAG: hydrolase [Alphaproteobacteria bacterium]